MSTDPSDQPRYSIAAVSKLTGVSCHTLRVWERRYGFPVPCRTPSGHRRYPPRQVLLIAEVTQRTRDGVGVAQAIAEARRGSPVAPEPGRLPALGHDDTIPRLIDALVRAELEAAEARFGRACAGLGPAEVATRVIGPAITEAGERLFCGSCSLCQERLAVMFLLRKLSALLDEAQRANVRPVGRVLSLSLQGDRHEGGSLMLCLAAELAGWRAVSLGADLPTREIQHAIDAWSPAAVGISLTLSRNIRKRFDELARLRGAPVFVGGRSVVNYQGLARRCGLEVILGPAIPNVARFLDRLRDRPGEGDGTRAPSSPRAGSGRE
ncbi:MerR family transcriptional regulator [Tautonia sociabilis]|uniref:MerR family transcriptional regulator n=1 Tax=Tautonia sociabilis TaxID=2080755 RepID=UPI0013153C2F|nr:MerR family transcriptional regulator [Tautonia sociabilis]